MDSRLLIYVPERTPRIDYIFSLLFDSIIYVPYIMTNNKDPYSMFTGMKMNYSTKKISDDEFFVFAAPLLFEDSIKQPEIKVSEWEGLITLFATKNSQLPFDIFSAAFYLVSRYEEYFPSNLDEHGRFRHQDSIAFKNNFLTLPIINLWILKLKEILHEKFPALTIMERRYSFIPTMDIDVAYKHRGRTISVTAGSFSKSLLEFRFGYFIDKALTLSGLKKDDYDTYKEQQEIFKSYRLKPFYFILSGKRSKYDKNINPASQSYKTLLKKLSEFATIGIHPSYHSSNQSAIVKEEILHIENCLGKKVNTSRQHYLRVSVPLTYRCLAELEITDDYSMAYAGHSGFRAGVCTPFPFYDLEKDKVLPVTVHSPVVMDGTLCEYMKLSPEKAILLINKLIQVVKECKGEFISIWHNHSLNDKGAWKGWKVVFDKMIEASN